MAASGPHEDGGNEGFGFDVRTDEKPIVMIPFIGMEWDVAIPMGANFWDFLEALFKKEYGAV